MRVDSDFAEDGCNVFDEVRDFRFVFYEWLELLSNKLINAVRK